VSEPTWTILVASLAQRHAFLSQLLRGLTPQLTDDFTTVLVLVNRGERPLGAVRQDLVEHATSDYVSFVDDDDDLPPYHVQAVREALRERPDYVGWRMQTWVDGEMLKPTYHSLRYASWYDDDHGYYRDVSHLNPVRRDLALLGDFRRGDPPEDVSWASQLRGHLRREVYVDRVMYHYRHRTGDSTWAGTGISAAHFPPLDVTHPRLSYHPASTW
jgi:glycosyltransferase involved in cell wall biosynthesis